MAPDRSEEDCRETEAQVILRSITMVGSQGRKGKCSHSCSESLIDAGGWYSFFCLGLSSLGSENAQRMSQSLFSGCRGMQGIPISNIKRHGRDCGSVTFEPSMGRSRASCNGTRDCAIEHFFME